MTAAKVFCEHLHVKPHVIHFFFVVFLAAGGNVVNLNRGLVWVVPVEELLMKVLSLFRQWFSHGSPLFANEVQLVRREAFLWRKVVAENQGHHPGKAIVNSPTEKKVVFADFVVILKCTNSTVAPHSIIDGLAFGHIVFPVVQVLVDNLLVVEAVKSLAGGTKVFADLMNQWYNEGQVANCVVPSLPGQSGFSVRGRPVCHLENNRRGQSVRHVLVVFSNISPRLLLSTFRERFVVNNKGMRFVERKMMNVFQRQLVAVPIGQVVIPGTLFSKVLSMVGIAFLTNGPEGMPVGRPLQLPDHVRDFSP